MNEATAQMSRFEASADDFSFEEILTLARRLRAKAGSGMGVIRVLALATLGLLLLGSPLSAQSPPMRRSPGRYLFVVDTSKAMHPRASAVQGTLESLLFSSLPTQLRPGDTIGVWTYNEQLYAGHLPLQQWTPEHEQLVASNILAFVKLQPFEKQSRPEAFWPELERLVRESEKLTVLFISGGSEAISGTPFDREVNEFFKEHSLSQQRKRMPFVTVFRSYRGKLTSVTLNLAPWPVEFPPFPPEPKIAKTAKPKPAPEKSSPRPTAPPLIVIGEKPAPAPFPTTPPADPAPTESATPANHSPPDTSEPKPSTEPTLAGPSKPTVDDAAPAVDQPAVAPLADSSKPPATLSEVGGPAATAQPGLNAAPGAPPPAETALEAKPPTVESRATQPGPIVTTLESKPVSPSAAELSAITAPAEMTSATVTSPAESEPTQGAPPGRAETLQSGSSPTTQLATATQPERTLNTMSFVIVGLIVLALGFVFFLLMHRRARAAPRASLITRSMDQGRK